MLARKLHVQVVDNVYVLPGVPRLFEQMIRANVDRFAGIPLTKALVYTYAARLRLFAEEEHPWHAERVPVQPL